MRPDEFFKSDDELMGIAGEYRVECTGSIPVVAFSRTLRTASSRIMWLALSRGAVARRRYQTA